MNGSASPITLLYTFMYTYPGKKLLFMGCEFGQGTEWNSNKDLDWYVLDYAHHKGVQTLVKDLNHIYQTHSALFTHDFDHHGFEWIDCHDVQQSIISYRRKNQSEELIVVLNFTPVPEKITGSACLRRVPMPKFLILIPNIMMAATWVMVWLFQSLRHG